MQEKFPAPGPDCPLREAPLTPSRVRSNSQLRVGAEGRPPYPLGPVQRMVLRLLRQAASPLDTGDVIRRTHSHLYRRGERPVSKLYANVRRALDRFGVRVGVRIGRPGRPAILWQIRDEFRR